MKASCHHFDGKDMVFLPFLQIFEEENTSYIRLLTSFILSPIYLKLKNFATKGLKNRKVYFFRVHINNLVYISCVN